MTGDFISNYESAIKLFESISGWKDADEQIIICQKKIAKRKRIVKINRKIAIFTCAIITFIIILKTVIIPNVKYNNAIKLMNAGKFDKAYYIFSELRDYKDSADKANSIQYNNAIKLINDGSLDKAYYIFSKLGNYKDSADKANNILLTETKKPLKSAEIGSFINFGSYDLLSANMLSIARNTTQKVLLSLGKPAHFACG